MVGIALDELRIDIEGELNLETFLGVDDGHAGYDTLHATVHIESDADETAIRELHDKVVATSPVGHTLSRAIPVAINLA